MVHCWTCSEYTLFTDRQVRCREHFGEISFLTIFPLPLKKWKRPLFMFFVPAALSLLLIYYYETKKKFINKKKNTSIININTSSYIESICIYENMFLNKTRTEYLIILTSKINLELHLNILRPWLLPIIKSFVSMSSYFRNYSPRP